MAAAIDDNVIFVVNDELNRDRVRRRRKVGGGLVDNDFSCALMIVRCIRVTV